MEWSHILHTFSIPFPEMQMTGSSTSLMLMFDTYGSSFTVSVHLTCINFGQQKNKPVKGT